MELKITESNFNEEVLTGSMPVLVDFYADWCGPCKMMAPIVEKLAEAFEGKCKVGKCNIDDNMELAKKYRVMSIPTIMLFKDGAPVFTHVGAISQNDLEAKINQAI